MLLLAFLASALTAWAQSPHVYRNNKFPTFSVSGERMTINTPNQNASAHFNQLFGRQGTDPTLREQEMVPLFPLPNCFWCPPQPVLQGNGWQLLAQFTTDQFQRVARATENDLRGTCLFYTKAVNNPNVPLSRRATQLACKFGKYSIWHLWPNRRNEAVDNRLINYYGIFSPTNRLYPISQLGNQNGKPGRIIYFENMSRAMANMCTGNIYVLSDTPQNLMQYFSGPLSPNIFATTEIPALRSHLNTLGDLIVIDNQDTANQPRAWKTNWRTLNTQTTVNNWKREGEAEAEREIVGWEPYDLGSELEGLSEKELKERAGTLCNTDGTEDEQAGEDYFG